MRIVQGSILAVGALVFTAAVATATTIGYTEGDRPLVAGTIAVADNADDTLPGFNLGALSTSGLNTINLFGRITTSQDIYQLQTTSPFRVDFIFGGYDLAAGGHVSDSGFVADPTVLNNPGNTSEFKLRITSPGDTLLGDEIYSTPYISGDSFIFSATGTGTYRLRVDGGVGDDGLGGAAYYDIRITAVPSPIAGAGLPGLLIAGGGLLGWCCRKRKASAVLATA